MPDYELERLNTRSFEQLIQSLGTKVLGPQIMIFGDGPDGGREATFDGLINYPPTKKAWNGYGLYRRSSGKNRTHNQRRMQIGRSKS